MAAGTIVLFNQFYGDIFNGVHDLTNDTIKLALLTSAVTPTSDDATPRWGASSGVDYDGNECTAGGNYASGGVTLATTITVQNTTDDCLFDLADLLIASDASNPTDAHWGLLYNDSATNKEAIGFVDFDSDRDLSTGAFSITWDGTGFTTLGQGTLT